MPGRRCPHTARHFVLTRTTPCRLERTLHAHPPLPRRSGASVGRRPAAARDFVLGDRPELPAQPGVRFVRRRVRRPRRQRLRRAACLRTRRPRPRGGDRQRQRVGQLQGHAGRGRRRVSRRAQLCGVRRQHPGGVRRGFVAVIALHLPERRGASHQHPQPGVPDHRRHAIHPQRQPGRRDRQHGLQRRQGAIPGRGRRRDPAPGRFQQRGLGVRHGWPPRRVGRPAIGHLLAVHERPCQGQRRFHGQRAARARPGARAGDAGAVAGWPGTAVDAGAPARRRHGAVADGTVGRAGPCRGHLRDRATRLLRRLRGRLRADEHGRREPDRAARPDRGACGLVGSAEPDRHAPRHIARPHRWNDRPVRKGLHGDRGHALAAAQPRRRHSHGAAPASPM